MERAKELPPGVIGYMPAQDSEKDESMVIPAGHFVLKVDLDCDEPYCTIATDVDITNDKKILIPQPLAYYLTTHFCGSEKMREAMIERGRVEVRQELKKTLRV